MKGKYRILLVDDELAIGKYVKKTFEKNEDKFEIDYFSNPEEALEKLKENIYDLFIVDLIMPQMSGFELAEEIRKIKSYSQVPLVIYSSVTSSKDRVRAISEPIYAEGFISKGDDSIDLLVHQIRSIFWRREALDMEQKTSHAQELGKSIGHVAGQSLTVINGYAEILEKSLNAGKLDKEQFTRFVHTIKDNANKIKEILEYVKKLDKIEMIDIGAGDKIIKVL